MIRNISCRLVRSVHCNLKGTSRTLSTSAIPDMIGVRDRKYPCIYTWDVKQLGHISNTRRKFATFAEGERKVEKEVDTKPSVPERSTGVAPTRNRKRITVSDTDGEALTLTSKPSEITGKDTVVATCSAEGYDLKKMLTSLLPVFPGSFQMFDDVLYVKIPRVKDSKESQAEAFVFGEGCFVLWGSQRDIAVIYSNFHEKLKPFEINSFGESETETLPFEMIRNIHWQFQARIEDETITIEYSGDAEEHRKRVIPAKLAFSHGLADSVKLAILENALNNHIEKVKPIPARIAEGKRLPLSRSQVLRLTGELLKFRADLNLHSELIDTPEIYWSAPDLEVLYSRVSKVLDVRQRVHVLNKKLDYANELASVLRTHLSEQHNLKLEWGIIILIAVEVAFETLHWLTPN